LIAMIFLRRTVRTSKTLLLQSLAIAWFVTALTSRLASNPLIGLPLVPGHTRAFAEFANPQAAEAYMVSYFNVVIVLGYVEKALFIAVAIVLLGFYRDQLGGRDRYLRSIGGAKTDEYRQV
jgi:hypothetical protein